jgi:hypothetical protein
VNIYNVKTENKSYFIHNISNNHIKNSQLIYFNKDEYQNFSSPMKYPNAMSDIEIKIIQ